MPARFQTVEHLLVVAVEGVKRGLQFGRRVGSGSRFPDFARALLRQCCLADVLPQVPVDRHVADGRLSATGTRGNLTMPHSMASISEKSLTVHGNSVPSA